MKKIITIFILLFFVTTFLSGCSLSNNKEINQVKFDENTQVAEKISEKEQAREFSLKAVKTYFDNDCRQFVEFLDTTTYDLYNPDRINLNEEDLEFMRLNSCDISFLVNEGHDFNDYLNSYNIYVFDKNEYKSKHPESKILNSFDSDHSYLFQGNELKNKTAEDFIEGSPFIFMVKKENGTWKVSHISG
jgi:hypothetical protein